MIKARILEVGKTFSEPCLRAMRKGHSWVQSPLASCLTYRAGKATQEETCVKTQPRDTGPLKDWEWIRRLQTTGPSHTLQLHQWGSNVWHRMKAKKAAGCTLSPTRVLREAQSQDTGQKQGHCRDRNPLAPTAAINMTHSPIHSQINKKPHVKGLFTSVSVTHHV